MSMRKGWLALILLSLIGILMLTLPLPARKAEAISQSEATEKFEETTKELLDELNIKELEEYLNGLSEFQGINLREKLSALISGKYELDYSSLFRAALSVVMEEGKALLPAFAVILSVTILCGIVNSAKTDLFQGTMSDIISMVFYLSVGAVLLACLIEILQNGFRAVENLQRQTELVYPILLTLMAASGGSVSATVFRPAVAFFSGSITRLFSSVVFPVSLVIIVLSFIGNLSDSMRLNRLGELFKGFARWIIGLSLGLFSIFITVQGISSAQYDGLTLRAMRYLIGGSVPIVGGFLSGGIELVVAGSAVIQNAVGTFAIFLLVATILKPLLLLVTFQLFLRLCAAATESVGAKISPFLSRLAGDLGYFIAGLLCIAFLYFLTLLLLVCSAGVFFS